MDVAILLCFLLTFLQAIAGQCPSQNWYPFQSDCYLFVNVEVNWTTAKDLCNAQHAHLVRNDNAGVDVFLREAMKAEDIRYVWTGANDITTESVFVWEDSGAPVNYTDWEDGNPNNYREQDCVRFGAYKSWNDLWCDENYMYACQAAHQTNDQMSMTSFSTTVESVLFTSDDVDKTTTVGDVEESTTADDKEHTFSSANVEMTTNSGEDEQTTSSDDITRTTESINFENTTTSMYVYHTTSSGDVKRTTSSGDVDHTTSSGDVERTTSSGDGDHTTSSGDVDHTTSSGDVDHATSSSDVERTTSSGDVEHTTSSGDVDHTTSSGDVDYTTSSGDVDYTTSSGDVDHTTSSGDVEHTISSGDLEHTTSSGDVDHTSSSGEVEHSYSSNELQHTTNAYDAEQTSTSNVADTSESVSTSSGMEGSTGSDDIGRTLTSGPQNSTKSGDEKYSTEAPFGQLCTCCIRFNGTQLTNEQKQQILAQLRTELFVPKENTSAYRRKHISADDFRSSSVTLGSLGCVLLSLIIGFLAVLDFVDLCRFLLGLAARKTAEEK